jgi:hypothetical protein
MSAKNEMLEAVRLVLGDQLAADLVKDDYNAANSLSDPFDGNGKSARYSIQSVNLSLQILLKCAEALRGIGDDFNADKLSIMSDIGSCDLSDWVAGGETPPAILDLEETVQKRFT